MRDSRDSDGAVLAIAVVAVIVLLAGMGAVFVWQRQQSLVMRQKAMIQMERAEAEAARARAMAVKPPADANQSDQQPNGTTANLDSIEAPIRKVIQAQQRAWNDGDIDQFMESYWKSEDLTFSSGGILTRTWQDTLENYKVRYPSRAEMGTLSFQNLEVTPLGNEAAFVLGEWHLSRDSQNLGGNFTLIFRRLDDKWVIVHDHTSRRREP